MADADVEGIAQGLAQRQHMPQQAEGAEHVLVPDPQSQALLRQSLERALDHRHGLAVGDALRGVLQVVEGKAQAAAQGVRVDAVAAGDFGQGLQQEG